MLEGNVRAAVRWLTERAHDGVLKPSDVTELFVPGSGKISALVLDALHHKHCSSSFHLIFIDQSATV